jgi:hypothetical protein
MEDKLTKQLNIAIGIVFIAAAGILAYSAVNRQAANQEQAETETTAQPEAPKEETTEMSEFDALDDMKEVVLAEQFESWTPEAKLDQVRTRSLRLKVKGTVEKAYFYAEATEGENGLTKWDSYYFKLNDLGGHLFRPQSLKTPAGKGTTLLYDLRELSFLPSVPYSEDRVPDHADLRELLKDGKTVVATTFISSLRQSTIEKASIHYTCAEGSDCSITIE